MKEMIPVSEVQEYDIIQFHLDACCGTLAGMVKGTVMEHRGELVVVHNKVMQARYSEKEQAGSPTFHEVNWLDGYIHEVELLFRKGRTNY